MCIVRNKINHFEQLCWDWGARSVNNVLARRCEPVWGVLACMYGTSTGDKRILRPNWPANLAYLDSLSAARDTTSPKKRKEKRKERMINCAWGWPLASKPVWTYTCGPSMNLHASVRTYMWMYTQHTYPKPKKLQRISLWCPHFPMFRLESMLQNASSSMINFHS